ncbi:meiotic recombination protein SPO11-like [Lineus longissimus]|uniref:meiotic recombination protein SPO11-like n=1 Tax=Lineus longissimus TaxID=88925 RepID=UPI00315D0457
MNIQGTKRDRAERISASQVMLLLEGVIKDVVRMISKNEPPVLSMASRTSWDNIRYTEGVGVQLKKDGKTSSIRFNSLTSVNKFALTLKVISIIYKLVQTDSYCTKRDLYYQDPHLFTNQAVVDDIVDNVSCMIQVPRWDLHVLATSKGCVAGDLKYTEADMNYVDCSLSPSGVMIPMDIFGIKNLRSDAKAIFVIEKDATFQRLLDDNVTRKISPCIYITGKGFPDVNTRLMLKRLWDEFKIPIFGLVDADPHGIEILSIYKFGSKALSFEAHNLTVPAIKWLGVLPSDIQRLNVPNSALIPLTKPDVDKARDLLRRPYILQNPVWKQEIDIMLRMGLKAEIQCLASISMNFLSEVYLPNKVRYGGWI